MKKIKFNFKSILIVLVAFITASCSLKGDLFFESQLKAIAQKQNSNELEKKLNLKENSIITSQKQLSFVGPRTGEGYFSLDGKKMIFQSERHEGNPFYQMYVLDLVSGKSNRVSTGRGKTTCGWIHPNLKTVLWSSTHLDPQISNKVQEEYDTRKKAIKSRYSWSFDDTYDIFTSDLNGKKIRQLTREKGYDAEASFSNDGKWIAFASNRSAYTEILSDEDKKYFNQDPSYMMDIYIMKADGSEVRRLTQSKGYDGGPFFSPDSKKITWRRFAPNGATAEIYTMNIDGSDQRAITDLGSMSWAPFFHPSGDYVIFTSSVLGYSNFELFIVDTEGVKKPVRVTFNEGFDGLPTFSPDGQQVSWTHRNEKGESQIYLADWNDQLARKLLDLPAKDLATYDFKSEIRQSDLQAIVYNLASPQLAGRKTGSLEEKIYTAYIADLFKKWGLEPAGDNGTFEQVFEFTSGVELEDKNYLEFVGAYAEKLKVTSHYLPMSFSKSGQIIPAPYVFAGYGIKAPASDKVPAYDSYKDLDVKGKWVMVFADFPENIQPEVKQNLMMYSRLQHKVTVAKNEGAIGLVVIDHQKTDSLTFSKLKFEGTLSNSDLFVLKISQDQAEKIMKSFNYSLVNIKEKLDRGDNVDALNFPSSYLGGNIQLKFTKSKGINVIGKVKSQIITKKSIIVGAHGDHLGRGETGSSLAKGDEKGLIHSGADDNASGVAAVLELAHKFSQNKNIKMNQNIYFAIWSGEEIGLLGSNHFVNHWKNQNNSEIQDVLTASINLDMVGRFKEKLYIQGVGSADLWSQINEELSFKNQISLSLQEDPYLPTDAMSLYLAKVPSISLFTGVHSEYHTPRDQADLINFKGLEKITTYTESLINYLVESQKSILRYIKVGGNQQSKLEGRTFRIYLGTIPDYTQEGVKGVKISGTSKESPADLAGLKEKDIVIELDGKKIENLYDYVYLLQSIQPNKETSITVLRQGEEIKLRITPKLKE